MGDEELVAAIQTAVKSAIHNELGQYKVPKEQHYEDHKFIQWWRDFIGDVQESAVKSFINTVVVAMLTLVAIGAYYFFNR